MNRPKLLFGQIEKGWQSLFLFYTLVRLLTWIFLDDIIPLLPLGINAIPLNHFFLWGAIASESLVIFLFFIKRERFKSSAHWAVFLSCMSLIIISLFWNYSPGIKYVNAVVPIHIFGRGLYIYLLLSTIFVAWQYTLIKSVVFITILTLLDLGAGRFIIKEPIPQSLFYLFIQFISLLLTALIIHRLTQLSNRQHKQLIAANKKLTGHAAAVEELAISWERNRLSRELHDTLAHSLSALIVQLEATRSLWDSPQKAMEMLEKAELTARSGLVETRSALKSLRSAPLQEFGLIGAIKLLVEQGAERIGAQYVYKLPQDQVLPLAPQLEQSIYRIFQEGITNIIRHSGADKIIFDFCRNGDDLVFKLIDNGKGFSVSRILEKSDHSFGLLGMTERADLINAELNIDSGKGKGTAISIKIHQENSK